MSLGLGPQRTRRFFVIELRELFLTLRGSRRRSFVFSVSVRVRCCKAKARSSLAGPSLVLAWVLLLPIRRDAIVLVDPTVVLPVPVPACALAILRSAVKLF